MSIRWGIIGCGDVARKRVARAIQEAAGNELLAACRRSETARTEFCNAFGVPRSYDTASALIADSDVDAVYIATPVNLHLPQTLAAAKAGKHVLCEKPMAMSVAECDQMMEACRNAKVTLGVAYYRRFYPAVARIRGLIESGALGRIMSISAVTSTRCSFADDEDGYWRVVPSAGGGGALMDVGSHRLHLFSDLLGPIIGVKAYCDTVAAAYEAEDCASVIVKFAQGAHGTLQCYFGTELDHDAFSVIGTRGYVHTPSLNDGVLTMQLGDDPQVEHHPAASNFNTPLIADFSAAIRESREPLVAGSIGRAVNAVMQAAYDDAAESSQIPDRLV